MKTLKTAMTLVPLSTIAVWIAGCNPGWAADTQIIAQWNFNNTYVITDGVGLPTGATVTANSNVELAGVKLSADLQNQEGNYWLTAVRPAYDATSNPMQSQVAAYLEVKSINADGAALHMTNPLPTPVATASTYTFGSTQTYSYPDGASYSYEKPYNYYEIQFPATDDSYTLTIKSTGHKSSKQIIAATVSTDGENWTVVGDNYILGNSYNSWAEATIDITGLTPGQTAYVRLMPSAAWVGHYNDSPYSDNQWMLDQVTLQGYVETPVIDAFPGAEGAGRFTTGGRGGSVYHVTSLTDDGNTPGTLRYAINQTCKRTIVFDVAGIIDLESDLVVNNGDLTIAGQTAPGDGICLRSFSLHINANNVIMRYIRCRLGDEKGAETDCSWGRFVDHVIIDHCSFSWSTDECASYYNNTNFTMQWCFINESLGNSVHVKGAHGYGALWGGRPASYHHNMMANHQSRTPRLVGNYEQPEVELVDLRNNVFYNWGANLGGYGGSGGAYNFINNYYKPGPATNDKSSIAGRILMTGRSDATYKTFGRFYMNGNRFDTSCPYLGDKAKSLAAATDANNYEGLHLSDSYQAKALYISSDEFAVVPVSTHTADVAFQKVLDYGGCSLARDSTDRRVVKDVRTGTYQFEGSNGSTHGIIDTPNDVGGYDAYTCTKNQMAGKQDSDGDGIPDDVEDRYGLDANDPSDGNLCPANHGGYTWLEVYMNSLVNKITQACLADTTTGIDEITTDKNRPCAWTQSDQEVSCAQAHSLTLYGMDGKVKTQSADRTLSLKDITAGIYIVVATQRDGSRTCLKIVK